MRPSIRVPLAVITLALLIWYCRRDDYVKTGVLNIRMEAAPTSLNPLLPSTGYSNYVAGQVFQTLGIPDPETLVMKPSLAKSIQTGKRVPAGPHQGELAYEFEIHEAATWDNGTPVTAEDFIFTLKVILHQGFPDVYRQYYQYLSGVDIDLANPKKFTVYMREFYILSLETLCSTPVYPAYNYDPKGLLKNVPLTDLIDPEKGKAFAESENGKAFVEDFTASKYSNEAQFISASGAYALKSMNGDQGTILIKKKNWWGDQVALTNPMLAAYPEQLVYKIVKSEPAVQNMLQTGDLDVAVDLSLTTFKEMQQDTHLTRLYDFKTGWSPRYGRLVFNLRQPDSDIFADVRLRRALAYAIDYDYLVNTVQQGFAQQIVGPIHPKKAYYAKDIPLYTYNPTEVRRLLDEAGWKDSDGDGVLDKMINGKRTRLSVKLMTPNGNKVSEMVSQSISEKARQLQMEIILDPQDISIITPETRKGNFQLASIGAITHTGLDELTQYYHSTSSDNRGRYKNTRLDSIIEHIRTTEDESDRNALYLQAQQILHDDVPCVFLFASARRYVISKKFNYVITPAGSGFMEQLFQLKESALK